MDLRVVEFHYIMPMENILSVLSHGILSFERAAKLMHRSIAMQEVQDRRDQKQVPSGLKLHQYANLYFHARNPMLYKRRDEADSVCVLRVSTEVLKIDGVVLADCNASSDYVRFLDPSQWELLDFDSIYAMDWRHPGDPVAYYRHRSRKCAEVLVPNRVDPQMILGAYVVDDAAAARIAQVGFDRAIATDRVLFFR